jgi:hypothetical protein
MSRVPHPCRPPLATGWVDAVVIVPTLRNITRRVGTHKIELRSNPPLALLRLGHDPQIRLGLFPAGGIFLLGFLFRD